MTFKEWFNSAPHRAKYTDDHPAYLAAKEAWDAAHEVCANVCDDMASRDKLSNYFKIAANAIRARGQK